MSTFMAYADIASAAFQGIDFAGSITTAAGSLSGAGSANSTYMTKFNSYTKTNNGPAVSPGISVPYVTTGPLAGTIDNTLETGWLTVIKKGGFVLSQLAPGSLVVQPLSSLLSSSFSNLWVGSNLTGGQLAAAATSIDKYLLNCGSLTANLCPASYTGCLAGMYRDIDGSCKSCFDRPTSPGVMPSPCAVVKSDGSPLTTSCNLVPFSTSDPPFNKYNQLLSCSGSGSFSSGLTFGYNIVSCTCDCYPTYSPYYSTNPLGVGCDCGGYSCTAGL
jgi:hypothetical protein